MNADNVSGSLTGLERNEGCALVGWFFPSETGAVDKVSRSAAVDQDIDHLPVRRMVKDALE